MDPFLSSRLFVLGYLFYLAIFHASVAEARSQWAHDVKRNRMTINAKSHATLQDVGSSKLPFIFYPSSRPRDQISDEGIRPHISVTSSVRSKSFWSPPIASVHIAALPDDRYSPKRGKARSALFSASSTIMDFNEDTRKYFPKTGMHPQKRQLYSPVQSSQFYHRHTTTQPYVVVARTEDLVTNHKNHNRKKSEQNILTEDVSCTSCDSQPSKAPVVPTKKRIRIRVPAKVLIFSENKLDGSHKENSSNKAVNEPSAEVSLLSLHSPTRIYIPVRRHEENVTPNHSNCIRCPANQTLESGRGETCVQVPIPAVSVCPFLAHLPGRVNVAITSGPSPGAMISEGIHPVELILWKKGGHLFHCKYTLTVKVSRCKSLLAPKHGSVECTNGTIWGSQCHFTCLANYVLIGHHYASCEGTAHDLSWTSESPKCKRKRIGRVESLQKFSCKRPDVPISGTVLCNKGDRNGLYSVGSVCQFFCFHGYRMSVQSSQDSVSVCYNGTWSPSPNVTCVATKCSKPPESLHGTYKCQEISEDKNISENMKGSKLINGTICKHRCEIGYVIPTSQLAATNIECIAPDWNTSVIPDCKRAIPPVHHPDDCHNQTLLTDVGNKVQIKFPRFSANSGLFLRPICSQPTLLPAGNHVNFCEVTDPELRVTTTCSYEINIIERVPPVPHPKDCRNKTLKATREGTAIFKPPRFLSTGQNANRTLTASCKYSGVLTIGSYINNCSAQDINLNTTGHCTFTVSVKGVSCPKPHTIPHGKVKCLPKSRPLWAYPPHTVCEYLCNDGYVLPSHYMKQRIWKCLPKLQWNKSILPICKKAIAPKPHHKDCKRQVLLMKKGKKLRLKPPRFLSSFKGAKVKVRCSMTEIQEVGNYTNFCEAKDVELRLTSTCSYNVIVKAKHCSPLAAVPNSELLCTPSSRSNEYLVRTVCRYLCHDGFVIPTSQLNHIIHHCTEYREWNSTILPTCVPKISPQYTNSSCLQEVFVTTDLSTVTWTMPEFISYTGYPLIATCIPRRATQYGYHNITCIAQDPELRINGSCQFTIDIQEPNKTAEFSSRDLGCPVPKLSENSFLDCDFNYSDFYPVSTVCQYTCKSGYAISRNNYHQISIFCNRESQWNSTMPPACEAELPTLLEPGCQDQSSNESYPFSVEITIPQFITSRNTSAEVTCLPDKVEEFGKYNITCKAYDSILDASSTCQFSFIVSDISEMIQLETTPLNMQNVTFEPVTENIASRIQCNPLPAPTNGHLTCTSDDKNDSCDVHCNPEFNFPSDYDFFKQGIVNCDQTDGLWDFQRIHNITEIPDCLGELPMTSLRVWLKFEVSVSSCNDSHSQLLQTEIKNILLTLNAEMCEQNVMCSEFQFLCFLDQQRNHLTLKITWIVEASFNPADYEDSDLVPNVETQIEMVMENTQRAITTEQEMNKQLALLEGQLLQSSYVQSRFLLVCQQKGFVVDPKTVKCVQCPSGTMEINSQCIPCPEDHYQEQTGQVSCKSCPDQTHSLKGSRSSLLCTD